MAPPEVVSTRPCPAVPAFKERPILFSAPMVRALLDGTKTQTRRVACKGTIPAQYINAREYAPGRWRLFDAERPDASLAQYTMPPCPYGQLGDRLWVRETYFAFGRWETRYSAKKGRDEWHFVDMTLECGYAYRYATDGDGLWPMPGRRQLAGATPGWWKRPAIFMPRAASRIDLEETAVRVELLQDISEADARAEGARECDPVSGREVLLAGHSQRGSFVLHYRDIWEQINGAGSWAANPWVWCVEFRRIRP